MEMVMAGVGEEAQQTVHQLEDAEEEVGEVELEDGAVGADG
jgi:hypothetical protein